MILIHTPSSGSLEISLLCVYKRVCLTGKFTALEWDSQALLPPQSK